MTNHEDTAMSHLLRQVPTAGQPPLERIQARAQTLRRRRRGTIATVSVLAAAAIATPVVGAIGDQGAEPGFADTARANESTDSSATTNDPRVWEPSNCGSQGDQDHRTAEELTLREVPGTVRLLWSESAAEAPTSARAEDPYHHFDKYYPESCHEVPEPTSWAANLVDVGEDDVISRVINISAGSIGKIDPPDESVVLQVGSVDVSVFRPDEFDDPPYYADVPSSQMEVSWTGDDGTTWRMLSHRNVTDEEIRDLVSSAIVEDGQINLDGSAVAQNAAFVIRDLAYDHYAPGHADYEATMPSLHLDVNELHGEGASSSTTLWAEVGDMYLADGINGNPAVVHMSGPDEPSSVSWEPVPGEVAASLRGEGYSADELLEIARSIEPVPADDERLIDVWGTCPADEYSSSLISPCDE